MASAPRSSGTDSLDTFRDALSKNMVAPASASAEPDDDAVREAIRAMLAAGRPIPVRMLAERSSVSLERVLSVLGLSPDTSPDQTVVGRPTPPARPARKARAKS